MAKIRFSPRDMKRRKLPERDAEMVSFPGFEKFQFVLYHDLDQARNWRVAEFTTGMIVGGAKKRDTALCDAEKILLKYGIDMLEKSIKAQLEVIEQIEHKYESVDPAPYEVK